MAEATTILVRRATRERLKRLGAKGESYDAVLTRLIEMAESRAPPLEWAPPTRQSLRGPSPRRRAKVKLEEWTTLD